MESNLKLFICSQTFKDLQSVTFQTLCVYLCAYVCVCGGEGESKIQKRMVTETEGSGEGEYDINTKIHSVGRGCRGRSWHIQKIGSREQMVRRRKET